MDMNDMRFVMHFERDVFRSKRGTAFLSVLWFLTCQQILSTLTLCVLKSQGYYIDEYMGNVILIWTKMVLV